MSTALATAKKLLREVSSREIEHKFIIIENEDDKERILREAEDSTNGCVVYLCAYEWN